MSVPTGYYIVKDKDNTQNKENGEYSLLMINVVGDVTLTAKMDTPEVFKKVTDVNDSTAAVEADQDSADYDIGDKIPYTLTFKLPANYADSLTQRSRRDSVRSTSTIISSSSIRI